MTKRNEDRVVPAFLGVTSVLPIDPNVAVGVVSSPQVHFRMTRLYVVADCADFQLLDIQTGRNSVFSSNAPIPAEAFVRAPRDGVLLRNVREALAQGVPLRNVGDVVDGVTRDSSADVIDIPPGIEGEIADFGRVVSHGWTVQPGMRITTRVCNLGSEPRVFRAVYFGETLDA